MKNIIVQHQIEKIQVKEIVLESLLEFVSILI